MNHSTSTNTAVTGSYVDVNGLKMYYETHPAEQPSSDVPLVLIHGALSATGTSFGTVLPGLVKSRTVISVEQQSHGHTYDIDRPLRTESMADDSVSLLRQIGVQQADFFGYSMGAGIAFEIAVRYPHMVRKLVLASFAHRIDGMHPGLLDGLEQLKPEMLFGSPFHDEYLRLAPRPEDFPKMFGRVMDLNRNIKSWTDDDVRSLQPPVLLIIGDSDIVRPEGAVEMFRLLGGGVSGDNMGLPKSRLAILPAASHIGVSMRGDWLAPMINEFLDTPQS